MAYCGRRNIFGTVKQSFECCMYKVTVGQSSRIRNRASQAETSIGVEILVTND